MSNQSPLDATLAYLRFPLRADHRGGLCDGSRCPHCPSTRVQKWGRFAGRQRFRCHACRRTFSTFTATPLRYLKRPDRWRTFLWCMEGRLTVRRSGAVIGIDKNTALRWRHRVLNHWREKPRRRLSGSVAVGEFRMALNEKGGRELGRRPRRHGWVPGRWNEVLERVSVIAAIETESDRAPQLWLGCSDVRIVSAADYARLLGPRLGHVREIVGGRGPICPLARFAGRQGADYRQERSASLPGPVLRLELRRWLRPLRGVATHRLDNYLEWFRRAAGPEAIAAARRADPRHQQIPQTEPQGAEPRRFVNPVQRQPGSAPGPGGDRLDGESRTESIVALRA